jgi:hypothetical protein
MPPRKIIHVDIDAFRPSVEQSDIEAVAAEVWAAARKRAGP